jgi:hypothetical protein
VGIITEPAFPVDGKAFVAIGKCTKTEVVKRSSTQYKEERMAKDKKKEKNKSVVKQLELTKEQASQVRGGAVGRKIIDCEGYTSLQSAITTKLK